MENKKKKFKETKLGQFLLGKNSKILNVVGDLMPDSGVLGIVKNLIDKDPEMPPADKEQAKMILDQEMKEMNEISNRWGYDMKSDNKLSKSVRPLTLIFLTISLFLFIVADSLEIAFNINNEWIELYKILLTTTYASYFGMRSAEKIFKK